MENYLKKIPYENLGNLRLHIYAIGYPAQGESILIVLAEGKKPLLTLVTDSFAVELPDFYNHVEHILANEWNTSKLDAFIWTHPHEDHSVGIRHLLEGFDKKHKADIFCPGNFGNLSLHPEFCVSAKNDHKYIAEKYTRGMRDNYHSATYDARHSYPYEYKFYNTDLTTNEYFNLSCHILLPRDGDTVRFSGRDNFDLNRISLVMVISLLGFDIMMTGDMHKNDLRKIENKWFQHINFIKIPHHASKSNDKFAAKMRLNACVQNHEATEAVTTVFRSGSIDLPNKSVIELYTGIGIPVKCTGPAKTTPQEEYDKFGCIHYIFNPMTHSLESLSLTGNAHSC